MLKPACMCEGEPPQTRATDSLSLAGSAGSQTSCYPDYSYSDATLSLLGPVFTPIGTFNPMMEDPLPGQMKKQLVLKIISGQQLPKPKDSMMGDRGEVTQAHTYTHIHTVLHTKGLTSTRVLPGC